MGSFAVILSCSRLSSRLYLWKRRDDSSHLHPSITAYDHCLLITFVILTTVLKLCSPHSSVIEAQSNLLEGMKPPDAARLKALPRLSVLNSIINCGATDGANAAEILQKNLNIDIR